MKKLIRNACLAFFALFAANTNAQSDVYTVTGGEMIFSQSQASLSQDFLDTYGGASIQGQNVRFTIFFHIGQYLHVDFSDNVGIFTGLGIRNVGMITHETLPNLGGGNPGDGYTNYNIVKRQYTLGLPLALKIGSFDKHFYVFGGGEIEWAFNYKQKYWTDQNFDRSGEKVKFNDWFADQTPDFLPSVFGGVQFPGGMNLRFKYYLTDFLNNSFGKGTNNSATSVYNVGDLSRYESSQLFYVSLCFQFDNRELKKD